MRLSGEIPHAGVGFSSMQLPFEVPVFLQGTPLNSSMHQARHGWNCFFGLWREYAFVCMSPGKVTQHNPTENRCITRLTLWVAGPVRLRGDTKLKLPPSPAKSAQVMCKMMQRGTTLRMHRDVTPPTAHHRKLSTAGYPDTSTVIHSGKC